jgi:hypothetical protein
MCFALPCTQGTPALTHYQREHVFYQLPGLLEYFGFVFAFGNLLAGPVIEFRDYQMWVNSEGPWAPNAQKKVPWTGDMVAVRVPLLLPLLLLHSLCVESLGSVDTSHRSTCSQSKSVIMKHHSPAVVKPLAALIASCMCSSLLCKRLVLVTCVEASAAAWTLPVCTAAGMHCCPAALHCSAAYC